ncbi:MAG: biotin transporter BioY [Clostridia bacterium]|nr:biotin transporter BioY [Clostridia bacterium]
METKSAAKRGMQTRDLAFAALCAALIAVCSWIQIPAAVPFTLQTFGVFLAVGLLGGKLGTIAVVVYIALGAFGLPVFSGFAGGLGKLLGPTGGYILGFLASALVMWAAERMFGKKLPVLAVSMVVGLLVCYAFGTAWFLVVYANLGKAMTLAKALSLCVVPFILPDALKIALALYLTRVLQKHLKV